MAKAQVVTMKQDKVCKSCVRFSGEGEAADQVAASLYLQNDAFKALGEPKKITVTVDAAK
jgi:hypothetical protein